MKKSALAKFVGAVNMHSFDIVSPESAVDEPEIEVGWDRFVAATGTVYGALVYFSKFTPSNIVVGSRITILYILQVVGVWGALVFFF